MILGISPLCLSVVSLQFVDLECLEVDGGIGGRGGEDDDGNDYDAYLKIDTRYMLTHAGW